MAAPVDLGTSSAFVVLGGAAVTNTGPSVLNGDLGVSPGTSLSGFGLPAVVNGGTHVNDGVAAQAQADATTAFGVAASQPVPPGNVLTGTDLGNRTLGPGAYRYGSSAQLTGALTLDGGGDQSAQFVFEIGSTLTTASASSIVLQNGASACNVFWQVGSSATLGTGTAFQGNLLASTAITLNTGASLIGHAFASTAAVTLDSNLLSMPSCSTPSVPTTPGPTPTTGSAGPGTTVPSTSIPGTSTPGSSDTTTQSRRTEESFERVYSRGCTGRFHALARGHGIAQVDFRLDGALIATRTSAPFGVVVDAGAGRHRVTARFTFSDGRTSTLRRLNYRSCARALLQPVRGPSAFTG